MAIPSGTQPSRRIRLIGKLALAIVFTVAMGFLLLLLAGVFQPKVPREVTHAIESNVADVPTGEVRLIRKPRYESAVGTIRAVHEVSVASRLLARITKVNVKAGQAITRGEVLVVLDDADLRARLEQAQAAESSAQAARERASTEFDRARRLLPSRAITQEDYDRAAAAVRTAAADFTRAQQTVRETRAILDYATIQAPISGIVIDKRVEVGDTATPGQVLLTLYDPGRMQMVATVRESLAQRLSVGQKIPGRLEALNLDCMANVSEIVPEIQAGSRSFTVKVTGPCPPGVYSGMFGRIFIPLDEESIVVVPKDAVFRVGQLTMVEVVHEGQRQRRSVQIGRSLEEGEEVLSGLKPGEKVVLSRRSSVGESRP